MPWWRAAPAARTFVSCSRRQGALVSRVLRVAVGAVKLDKSLARGQFRQLEAEEIEPLLKRLRRNADP